MDLYIGLDDTDNRDSRGTGYLGRKMAGIIAGKKLGRVTGITRHQLFIHPSILYTSQNSSACLRIVTDDFACTKDLCRELVIENAAPGSDAGLCIVDESNIGPEIIDWGQRAKKEVLDQDDAIRLAYSAGFYLEGLTGEHTGVIGALAAVGLRKSGNDGRFIWLEGQKELRDILPGNYMVEELIRIHNFARVITTNGETLDKKKMVRLGDWVRPLLLDNKVTLIVEKGTRYEWETASKDYIRTIS